MKKKAGPLKGAVVGAKASMGEASKIFDVLLRIAERMEALEKKMEVVIVQTSGRFSEPKNPSKAFQNTTPNPHSNRSDPIQNQGSPKHTLHRAICADCHKDCEVPFKPSGERPVYCKECFKKRKTAGVLNPSGPHTPASQSRQVRVTPNGAGKVTVFEVVPASTKKHGKPAKKKKK